MNKSPSTGQSIKANHLMPQIEDFDNPFPMKQQSFVKEESKRLAK